MKHKFVVIKDETSVYQECSGCKMVVYPEEHNIKLGTCLSQEMQDALAFHLKKEEEESKCEHGNIDLYCSACMYAANE